MLSKRLECRLAVAGLRLPVVAAPMFLISGPDLVVAACKSGIVGSCPAPNCRTVADLDCWMGQISDQLAGSAAAPWAINLATEESMAPPAYKQMVVDYGPDDLIITDGITGTPASWLRPSLIANHVDA